MKCAMYLGWVCIVTLRLREVWQDRFTVSIVPVQRVPSESYYRVSAYFTKLLVNSELFSTATVHLAS